MLRKRKEEVGADLASYYQQLLDGGGSYSINNDLIAPIKHVPTTLEKSFAPSKLLYICCGEAAEAGGPTDRPVN